jgi:hypothetical protein
VEELTRLLKVQGFDVISGGQAGATAETEQQRGTFPASYDPLYCLTPECANEFRKIFDATFAVQLTLFSSGPRPANVSVVVTEQAHVFFTGTASVEGRDIRAAVRTAFGIARDKQRDGVGPWLSVTGTPEGASVYIDGNEYGRMPFAKRVIEPGSHQLEIRADGHAPEQRTLEIPAAIDHVEQVEVHLGTSGAVAGSSRKRIVRSPWDWAVGGALVLVGAVHLTAGIYQKSVAGDCADRSDRGCAQFYGDRRGASRENLLLGFGAAGLAAGALVVGLGQIARLQVRSGVDRASLELTGEF